MLSRQWLLVLYIIRQSHSGSDQNRRVLRGWTHAHADGLSWKQNNETALNPESRAIAMQL